MPGRKQPRGNENERDHEYRQHQRRGGEEVAGDLGQQPDELGGRGEVRRERVEWREADDSRRAQSGLPPQRSPGTDDPEGPDGR